MKERVNAAIAGLAHALVSLGLMSGLNYHQGKAAFRAALFLMDEIDAGRGDDEWGLSRRATEFIEQELSQMSPEQRGYQ